MKIANPFFHYENLIKSIRVNNTDDLKKLTNEIGFQTEDQTGFTLALFTISFYVDKTTFIEIYNKTRDQIIQRTNIARIDYSENKLEVMSTAITGIIRLSTTRPPTAFLTYLSLAMFGEDAFGYRAVRVAQYYLTELMMKFTSIKDRLAERKWAQ